MSTNLMTLPLAAVRSAYENIAGVPMTSKQAAAEWLAARGYTPDMVRKAAGGAPVAAQPAPAQAPAAQPAQLNSIRLGNVESALSRAMDYIEALKGDTLVQRDRVKQIEDMIPTIERTIATQIGSLGSLDRRLETLGTDLADSIARVQRDAAAAAQAAAAAVRIDPAQVQGAIADAVRDAFGPIQAAAQANGTQAQVQRTAAAKVIGQITALQAFGIEVKDRSGKALMFDLYDHPSPPPVDPYFIWTEAPIRLLYGAQQHGARCNLWLGGEKGTGKTQTLQQFAARTGRMFVRINFHKDTASDEYLGAPGLTQGNTHFADGPFMDGYETPGAVLCLDEITNAHPGELAPLNGLLEPGARQTIGTRARSRAPGVIIGACDNTLGAGDPTGRYHGTREMNVALMQRFAWRAMFTFLPREVERKALGSITGKSAPLIDHLLDAVDKTRAAVKTGEVIDAPSIRDCAAFLMALDLFPVREAWAISIAAAQPVESAAALEGIFASCINPAFIEKHL